MKKIMIILFIIITLAADLKVTVFPYIHWVAWIILILPLIIRDILTKGVKVSPMFGITTFLIIFGMISSFFVSVNVENFIQIIKISLIFLTMYYFLYYSEIGWKEAVVTINSILTINIIFLFLGILGFSFFSSLMTGDGRWGTFIAYPGSLVKIGTVGFYFNLMAFLLIKERKLKFIYFVFLIFSLFIIFMDGSRTGMLTIVFTMGIVYILYFLMNFKQKLKVIVIPLVCLIVILSFILINLQSIIESRIATSLINLISASSFSAGLESVDSTRFMMIETAIKKIIENPFIGSGAFTTVGIYADGTSMVVHNTYLQFWGDFGLVGITGLLLMYFSWCFLMPKISNKIQKNKDIKGNVLVSFSILMLCYFIFNGLFHPYSTELSEWIVFIMPLTYVYSYYKGHFQER